MSPSSDVGGNSEDEQDDNIKRDEQQQQQQQQQHHADADPEQPSSPDISSNNTSSRSAQQQDQRLLQAAERALGISLLVYIYADLRLLAHTGFTYTPPTKLHVGSHDRIGSNGGRSTFTQDDDLTAGLLPGQIWALILAELRRQAARAKQLRNHDDVIDDPHVKAPLMYGDDATNKNNQQTSAEQAALIAQIERMVGQDMKPLDDALQQDSLKYQDTPEKFMDKHCPDTSQGACLRTNFGLTNTQSMLTRLLYHYRRLVVENNKQQASPQRSAVVAVDTDDSSTKDNTEQEEMMDNQEQDHDEMLHLLEQAVASHESDAFWLLAQQFQEDSLTRAVLENEAQLLWFQDDYAVKEPVFGVAVSRQTRTISVFFRGSVTSDNWAKDLDATLVQVPNPIQEDYDGKKRKLDLHRGFQSYLLRRRLDNSQSWCDRIMAKIVEYGNLLLDGDYQLFVTGHSMGGALATIFGFYASVQLFGQNNNRNQKHHHQPVVIYTFASPMLGSHSFADAFRHQERQGRLRLARFANGLDVVNHLPGNFQITKRGGLYTHVGMGVQLLRLPTRFFSLYKWLNTKRRPKVSYGRQRGFWSSHWQAFRNNPFFNVAPFRIFHYHFCSGYQERLKYAMEVDPELASRSLEDLYEQHAKW